MFRHIREIIFSSHKLARSPSTSLLLWPLLVMLLSLLLQLPAANSSTRDLFRADQMDLTSGAISGNDTNLTRTCPSCELRDAANTHDKDYQIAAKVPLIAQYRRRRRWLYEPHDYPRSRKMTFDRSLRASACCHLRVSRFLLARLD